MTSLRAWIRSLFLAILFIAASHAGYAQTEPAWPLDRCIAEALRNAPRLSAVRHTARAAQAAASEAQAARWPSFGLTAAYTYTSETQELHFGPVPIRFGDGNVYDINAAVRVPLFAGGALREKARADGAAAEAALWEVTGDSLKLVRDVCHAYFSACGAEARCEASRRSVNRLERHVRELEQARSVGSVTEEARVSALARLRLAEAALVAAEAEVHNARLMLGNAIGYPGKAIAPLEKLEHGFAQVEELSPVPVSQRAEVQALTARARQLRHLTRVSQAAWLPALSGSAAYHYGKPGVDMARNEWMDYYTLSVGATWTLWDWNARSQHVLSARETKLAADAKLAELQAALETNQLCAEQVLSAARRAREKCAQRLELERERLVLVESRWRAGMASESEFLDAQDDLTLAETDLAAAQARERIAEADLRYASGH